MRRLVAVLVLGACGGGGAPTPAPSALRGPEVNWRGRTSFEVPTEFYEKHGPRPVGYEVESLVDAVFAGAPRWRGVYSDGASLYFSEDYALRRVAAPLADATVLHGAPRGDGKVSDPLVELFGASPDGTALVGINARGASLLSPGAEDVTELPMIASTNAIRSPVFSDDGGAVYFSEVVAEPESQTRIHRFTRATAKDDVLLERAGEVSVRDAARGALILRGATLTVIDLSAKTETAIDASDARFGAAPAELVVLATRGAATFVERRDAAGKVLATSAALGAASIVEADQRSFAVDRRSGRVAVAGGTDGSLVALDLATLSTLPLAVPSAARVDLESIARDGRWVLRVAYADRPPELHVVDVSTGADAAWHRRIACTLEGECAPIAPSVAPIPGTWDARDGSKPALHARVPARCAGARCPVLVELVARSTPVFDVFAATVNEAGIVHVAAAVRPDVPTDADDLAAHVRRAFASGGQKVAVFGRGAMGARVLDVMTRAPGAFDAGASIDASAVPGGPGEARDPMCMLATLHGGSDGAGPPIGDYFEFRRELERRPIDVTLSIIRDDFYADFVDRGGWAKQLLGFVARVLGVAVEGR